MGRVVDLHAVGVGVVVALDPELEPGPDVVIGFGLPLGRLHLSIEDAAHDGGDEGRDAHHDEDAEDAEAAVRVIVVIQRLAVLGVEIQRIGAQVDVGLGCVGVVAVRQHGHDLIFDLLDAVIGKGRHAPAVGDGDVLAGAEGDHEQDAAAVAAGAEIVVAVVVLRVGTLVFVTDAVHGEEIHIAVVAVGGVLGASFQLAEGVAVEQAVVIPHQRGRSHGREAEADRQHSGGQRRTEAAERTSQSFHSAHLLISTAAR